MIYANVPFRTSQIKSARASLLLLNLLGPQSVDKEAKNPNQGCKSPI